MKYGSRKVNKAYIELDAEIVHSNLQTTCNRIDSTDTVKHNVYCRLQNISYQSIHSHMLSQYTHIYAFGFHLTGPSSSARYGHSLSYRTLRRLMEQSFYSLNATTNTHCQSTETHINN